MAYLDLIATSAFGTESIVARELKKLGVSETRIDNGRIYFKGDYTTIVKSNIWLRCSERVLMMITEFRAEDFGELFEGTKSVKWEDIIPENGIMHVTGKSVKSKLHSVPDCQSIVKKAIIEAMKRRYRRETFDEDGPLYKIEISMLKDVATISIDTSGAGLHKRGYRLSQGEAPIKETLAASIISLSRWSPDRPFIDPMCGSGTFPIEAALFAKNIAPGLNRSFASENWPQIPQKVWLAQREEAKNLIVNPEMDISGFDIDKRVFKAAEMNASEAGVSDCITFQKKPVAELSSRKKYGCIICNPPYGERMNGGGYINDLYREMGEVFSRLDTWSLFILTSYENFEKAFGRKSDKNRKLYNAKLKTYLYEYFGPRPDRVRRRDTAS
ncbi:MAG TPA: class I SAM-dependent RNA methyltransferase [Spirochaetota bacterium]|nr:class I SAM-dependent RNA methyltransferase [Spirochaetota bacterium]HPJ35765.1 class I SAM-dependent RNA methyltransferase [Spirochaetota bacterium]